MNITIDGKSYPGNNGETVLNVAHRNGIDIPALCYNACAAKTPLTSCLVCLVKINGRFVPSCATNVSDGMIAESETEEVKCLRKTALELLLSEHFGDCYGPCQLACPAHLDIPLMLRQIDAGDNEAAIRTIKKNIPLPAVLGRICPKPCEKVCRRKDIDSAVEICAVKQYAADVDLAKGEPYLPEVAPATGKSIAVLGAGPMGLSAAFYLALKGHHVALYSLGKPLGERLRDYPPEVLPTEVLDAEIRNILRLSITVETGSTPPSAFSVLDCTESNRVKPPMVIRSIADGKEEAERIHQLLTAEESKLMPFYAGCRTGKKGTEDRKCSRRTQNDSEQNHSPFPPPSLCLHCDCRGREKCKLLKYAAVYQADVKRFEGAADRTGNGEVTAHNGQSAVRYCPEKCIKCGLCITVAKKHCEELGLTFIGRGFEVHVGVPFDEPLSKALTKSAAEACAVCPTGALTAG